MHWLAHVLGLDNGSSYWYLWWSGAFPDLPLIGIAALFLWHHNCHASRCMRIGRFRVEGTPWTLCAKHHPTGPPTAADLER